MSDKCVPASSLKQRTVIINTVLDNDCAVIIGYGNKVFEECFRRVSVDNLLTSPPEYYVIGKIILDKNTELNDRIRMLCSALKNYKRECSSLTLFITDCRLYKSILKREALISQCSPVMLRGIRACSLLRCKNVDNKTNKSKTGSGFLSKIKSVFSH